MKRAPGKIGKIGALLAFLGVASWAATSAAAQDGNGTTTPTQPGAATVTLGTGTTAAPAAPPAPAADTAVKKPEGAEKKPAPRPFAGSSMFILTSANLNTFFPALQPNRNVTADMAMYLSPRFRINDSFQLRGRFVFNYEFTNSDDTTRRNEPRFDDGLVQLYYQKLPAFGGGFKVNPFVQVGLPISLESQARTMYFAPGLGAQLARPIEHVLGGDMLLLLVASYSHPLYQHTTAGLQRAPLYAPQCLGGTGCVDQASGAANTSDSISVMFLASQEWGKWNPAVLFRLGNQWAYTFKDIPGVTRLEDRTSFRQSTYFSAWLDYNANDWFTAEIGYWMSRNMLTGQGKISNPAQWVFDNTQDMRVYLGASLNLDNIAKTIMGQGGGGSGVVRARNERKGPVIGF